MKRATEKGGGGGGADTVCVCTIQEWCILQKFTAPYNKEGNTLFFPMLVHSRLGLDVHVWRC